MKKILCLMFAFVLSANLLSSFALTPDLDYLLEQKVKENAATITSADFDIDYTAEDAFDDFVLTKLIENDKVIVFQFNCKAKREKWGGNKWSWFYMRYADIRFYPSGEIYVYDKALQRFINPREALMSELIVPEDLYYIYKNYAYDYNQSPDIPPIVNDGEICDAIKEKANAFYLETYGKEWGESDFKDLTAYVYYDDEDVAVFKFYTHSQYPYSDERWEFWQFGDFRFGLLNVYNTYCVYDKKNDDFMLLYTAYENGIVGYDVLKSMSDKYLWNDVTKPMIDFDEDDYNYYITPVIPETNLDSDVFDKIAKLATEKGVKKIHFVYCSGEFDGNYVISYFFDENCIDGCIDEILGDYMLDYYSYSYGVYSSADNKIYSCKEAYEKGILTDERMYEIWQKQKGETTVLNFIRRIGDINRDGALDIVDVALYRDAIITGIYDDGYDGWHNYNWVADMNHDGDTDIVDVAILRRIIINGEH